MADTDAIAPHADGCVITLKVVPRASRTAIWRGADGSIVVRLTAPPVDGAANEALVRALADRFRIAKSAVRIAAGATGRRKRVVLAGVSPEDAAAILLVGRQAAARRSLPIVSIQRHVVEEGSAPSIVGWRSRGRAPVPPPRRRNGIRPLDGNPNQAAR